MKPLRYLAALLSLLPSLAVASTLTVAVAANMQFAFGDLQATFKKESGHDLQPIFGSSGKIAAQIMNGAPFDVFLSADMDYPQKLHNAGFTATAPQVYGYGALVLWTMKDFDLSQWQTVLSSPAVQKIALANPKTAPYGRETLKALAHFKLEPALAPKLVFGESIAQVNQYIHSNAADAGFTAKSVVLAPSMRGQGKWVEMPTGSYQPIAQGLVVLKHGQQTSPKAVRQFYDFMSSNNARSILERYGYLLP